VFRSSQAGVVFVKNRDQMENRRVNYCLRSGNGGGRACLVTPTLLPGRQGRGTRNSGHARPRRPVTRQTNLLGLDLKTGTEKRSRICLRGR
jgi:hypothetical protein